MRYFDDINLGDRMELGTHTFTAADIKAFATQYDPQAFHMDEEAAARSHFGALCASGWHTCCVMMKMVADGVLLDSASMGAPGIDEVRWLKPVRPGDSLTVRGSVLAARASQSKPDRGFVNFLWEVFNERDQKVMTLTCPQMLLRRNAGALA